MRVNKFGVHLRYQLIYMLNSFILEYMCICMVHGNECRWPNVRRREAHWIDNNNNSNQMKMNGELLLLLLLWLLVFHENIMFYLHKYAVCKFNVAAVGRMVRFISKHLAIYHFRYLSQIKALPAINWVPLYSDCSIVFHSLSLHLHLSISFTIILLLRSHFT